MSTPLRSLLEFWRSVEIAASTYNDDDDKSGNGADDEYEIKGESHSVDYIDMSACMPSYWKETMMQNASSRCAAAGTRMTIGAFQLWT